MEMLSPISPTAFDRRYTIAASAYYPSAASSSTSSSSPDLTSAPTVSTALTNDSDDDDHYRYRPLSRHSVVPKVEEIDEDKPIGNASLHAIDLGDDAKPPTGVVSLPSPPPRKKRGRPRKHPIVDPADLKKTSHARSKTGCGTCRRRKKKCDETKPACMNCEKNNVVCDGYEPKQPWRSGKQKALQSSIAIAPILPEIGPAGVETSLDKGFLDHFSKQVGNRLSLTDGRNPFEFHIMPMALENVGVMHGVLFLSSSCLLASTTGGDRQMFERREHHQRRALDFVLERHHPPLLLPDGSTEVTAAGADLSLTQRPYPASNALSIPSKTQVSPRFFIAQALILCLETIADGKCDGSWRAHISGMKDLLIKNRDSFPDGDLRRFILEFLLYHDYSSSITSLEPSFDQRSLDLMKDFQLPDMVSPAAGSLLGVLDGLFGLMSRIRRLRDTIRVRRAVNPAFVWISDHEIQFETYAIDEDIRKWKCCYPPDSPRFRTSLLYRQTTWVYLWRTVFASRPHGALKVAVDDGIKLLNDLPWEDEDVGAMQSVLLMPVFLLGCAAFEQGQRPPVRRAFERLKTWSSLGNIKYADEIVQEVWQLMDEGREDESWDWESLIARRKWDLLVT